MDSRMNKKMLSKVEIVECKKSLSFFFVYFQPDLLLVESSLVPWVIFKLLTDVLRGHSLVYHCLHLVFPYHPTINGLEKYMLLAYGVTGKIMNLNRSSKCIEMQQKGMFFLIKYLIQDEDFLILHIYILNSRNFVIFGKVLTSY